MPSRSKVRNVVVAVTAVLMAGLVGYGFIHGNPERKELERQRNFLDSVLIRRRAISRDLKRYQAEVVNLQARLLALKRRLSFDPDALQAHLEPLGVSVSVSGDDGQGSFAFVTVAVSGASGPPLEATFDALVPPGHIYRLDSFKLGAQRFDLRFNVVQLRESGVRPRRGGATVRRRPWYSRLNDDLVQENKDKQDELRKLDEQLGPAAEFFFLKKEFEQLLIIAEGTQAPGPVMRPLQALFAGPQAIFKTATISGDGPTLWMTMPTLNAEADQEACAKAVAPDMEVISFEESDGSATVQLSFTSTNSPSHP